MRVKNTEPSAPGKPAPDRARFQQALQQAPGRRGTTAPRAPGASPKPAGTVAAPRGSSTAPRGSSTGATGVGKPAASLPKSQGAVSSGKVVVQSRGALASSENLGHVRQGMHAEAQRLQHTRTEAQSVSQEHREHRVTELISRELARDFRAEPPRASDAPRSPAEPASEPTRASPVGDGASAPRVGGASPGATAPPEAPDAQLKAQAAVELIERIEVFVKSQRPALKMSLGGSLDATVEVERTGPREVALRIQGRRGPVPGEELSRIREALEAKGLRLRTLQAG